MIGKIFSGALLALTALPVVAADRVNLYSCDGCSVEQEREMVKGLTGELGTFDFYVANVPAQTIHKYQLARGWSRPPCSSPLEPGCQQERSVGNARPNEAPIVTYVYDKEVEQPYLEAYQSMMQFYYTEPVGFKKFYEFQIVDPAQPASAAYRKFRKDGNFFPRNAGILGNPINPVIDYPDPNVTPFDIAKAGPKRAALLDHVRDNMLQRVNIGMDNVAKVLSAFGIIDSNKLPAIDVIVYFKEGGQVTLRLNNSTTVPVYKVVEDSLRDSHGNSLPMQRTQLENEVWGFDYTGNGRADDVIDMRQRLQFLGAEVEDIHYAREWLCGSVNVEGRITVSCLPK